MGIQSPKCAACGHTSFKLDKPALGVQGAKFEMPFVVCSSCGAAVAVLSQIDPGITSKQVLDTVDHLQMQIQTLAGTVSDMKRQVTAIAQRLT